ncbi:molybdopterin molybdotransferase MoeA [Salinimicrobium soli]|uniref:molybdopterin molybdotransferase MoeA n=1 Tax=Salinimicrobium soli TaxID=1254399 RepID=UPI003AADA589
MVSIEEALNAVLKNSKKISSETKLPLENCTNAILSQDIFSPINMPPFRQSAMDGYAVNAHEHLSYSLVGEVKAGDSHQPKINSGEAIRIFTGAPVPSSANAVVIQEEVEVKNGNIFLEKFPREKQNIRPAGEQVREGELALKKGSKLTPAEIGYLASLGLENIPIYKKPAIAIVTTGNELISAGETLTYGKIYESNSKMLKSALISLGFDKISLHTVKDSYEDTYHKLKDLIAENDLVLITGGVSVGDYDFVGQALKGLETKEIFYKVNQKPGKPLFFGKNGRTLIFGLPGNPAAALTCFYMYVYPSVQKMAGYDPLLKKVIATSSSHFVKKGDRPQFLKAIYKEGKVTVLEGQSSAMLQTFTLANALVKMDGDREEIKINDSLEVFLLPV